jgi:hypothetical protein
MRQGLPAKQKGEIRKKILLKGVPKKSWEKN